jgi:hypothetical protein
MSNRKRIKDNVRLTANINPFREKIRRIQETFAGHYNGYICAKCHKGFLTLDVDMGVTPMFSQCFATEGCSGQARSMGYPDGEPPEALGDPIIHWVRPSEEEFKHLPPQLKEHVAQGGLIRKATEAAPDWVKTLLNSTIDKEN